MGCRCTSAAASVPIRDAARVPILPARPGPAARVSRRLQPVSADRPRRAASARPARTPRPPCGPGWRRAARPAARAGGPAECAVRRARDARVVARGAGDELAASSTGRSRGRRPSGSPGRGCAPSAGRQPPQAPRRAPCADGARAGHGASRAGARPRRSGAAATAPPARRGAARRTCRSAACAGARSARAVPRLRSTRPLLRLVTCAFNASFVWLTGLADGLAQKESRYARRLRFAPTIRVPRSPPPGWRRFSGCGEHRSNARGGGERRLSDQRRPRRSWRPPARRRPCTAAPACSRSRDSGPSRSRRARAPRAGAGHRGWVRRGRGPPTRRSVWHTAQAWPNR